jgi:N-methylhydantoinase A
MAAMTIERPQRPNSPDTTVYRVSVDTGGTFTDGFVTSGERSAQIKVDTTPYDPTVGFGACIAAAADAMGEELATFLSKSRMIHFSSTIATNAVVQRQGARVGLIVTAGQEELLYGSSDQVAALASFIPAEVVRGVSESVDSAGTVHRELDAGELEVAVRELLEGGVQVVVISLANSHLNPANEVLAKQIVEKSYPKHYLGAIPLMLSSDVSLVDDNHGRTALAVANAYIHPTLARSLYRAEDLVRRDGFHAPLQIVNTDGSSTRVAKTKAIDTFNSGPTAGVLGAAIVADALKAEYVVTFDVGGTTTDVAYIAGASAPRSTHTEFGPALVPHDAVDIWSFGLGGGSLITVDNETKQLSVGPQSAGAIPGPACFGLGGDQPTPTDVWLTLGFLEPGEFLSGRRHLDVDKARAAIGTLAEPLGISIEDAALAAYEAIGQAVGAEMREWVARQPGFDQSPVEHRWLFSYGGGGGLLAIQAAEALDIPNVAVFPQSSVFSAFGGGLLPIAHSYHTSVSDVGDPAVLRKALNRLAERAWRDLRAERVPRDSELVASGVVSVYGEATTFVLPAGPLDSMEDRLDLGGDPIAISGVGRVSLNIEVPRDVELRVRLELPSGGLESSRTVQTESGPTHVPVRAGLGRPSSPSFSGPAFLDARDTTIFVPANWEVEFNDLGYGLLRRSQHND